MAQYLDHEQLINSNIEETETNNQTGDIVKPMSDDEWENASADKMAEHISLDGPKTEYAKETNSFRKNADKL